MKRHYGQTKAQHQAEWLAQFSDALLTRAPALSSRIEWPAALYYYLAVDQYIIARNIES